MGAVHSAYCGVLRHFAAKTRRRMRCEPSLSGEQGWIRAISRIPFTSSRSGTTLEPPTTNEDRSRNLLLVWQSRYFETRSPFFLDPVLSASFLFVTTIQIEFSVWIFLPVSTQLRRFALYAVFTVIFFNLQNKEYATDAIILYSNRPYNGH